MAQAQRNSAHPHPSRTPAPRARRAGPSRRGTASRVEVVPAAEVEVLDANDTAIALEAPTRLARPLPELPASLKASRKLLEDLRQAGRLAERAIAPRTLESYRKSLRHWEAYCHSLGVAPYPPETVVVLAWLASMATPQHDGNGDRVTSTGLHAKTIDNRVAALNKACAAQGWARPGDAPEVAELLAGIRRTLGIAPRRQVAPLDPTAMRDVLAATYLPTLTQLRDRLLTIVLTHPDARPGSLLRVPWDDFRIEPGGLVIVQPPPARHGDPTVLHYPTTGDDRCPVGALRALRDHPGVPHGGPVFAAVSSQGGERYRDASLGRSAVSKLLARLAADAAVDAITLQTLAAVVAAIMAPRAVDIRDRALLLTALMTASRRANTCALSWRHGLHDRRGVRITFERTKTDQEGAGTHLWLPAGQHERTCPVTAWVAWRELVADLIGGDPVTTIPDAPMFAAIDRHDNVTLDQHLSGETFAQIVKRRVAAAGHDPAHFAGHSLRAGFITGAAEHGARPDQIQAVSGHKNLDVMMGYIRSVDAWKDNPAALLGL